MYGKGFRIKLCSLLGILKEFNLIYTIIGVLRSFYSHNLFETTTKESLKQMSNLQHSNLCRIIFNVNRKCRRRKKKNMIRS